MRKILIVDDSDLIAGVLTQHFSETGYEVVRASNGLEGVLAAYKEIPDLIVSDVEMPRLQGYQLSRLLKSKRGVRDIPIIMHTSLSDDKDRFWAMSSGVDAFITKDFDNLGKISLKVEELLKNGKPLNRKLIEEDGAAINEITAMEILGNLFDRELFRSTILNELAGVEKHIGSLSLSSLEVLRLLTKICDAHVGVLILSNGKQGLGYILPSDKVFKSEVKDFFDISLADFKEKSGTSPEEINSVTFGIEGREDYEKIRIDKKRLSSYISFPLNGKGETVIGTLHIGNLSNNYFSEIISDSIAVFVRGAGTVLENAVLFNRITAMENKIRNVFSKFVPPEIIKELLEQKEGETEMKVGEKRNVAILFSDIRSFTVISENNSAEAIVSFLNSYFQQMVSIIKSCGGVIDKFIGDAILAIFGAPVSYEDNAERAVRAAVGMINKMAEIETGHLVLPPTGFKTGIGIHEGTVIVGNIGSQDKFDYTVIGDNVNLASRLEGLTKHYHRGVIISEVVSRKVGGIFPLREVDTVRVKGREEPTTLYSIETESQGPLCEEAMQSYKKGLQMYKMSNWSTALEYFRKTLEYHPEDFLAQFYVERCTEFQAAPPPENWGGAVSLDFK
jgi:class 3 adenylate cyclase/CheY-like chemotaxis protein